MSSREYSRDGNRSGIGGGDVIDVDLGQNVRLLAGMLLEQGVWRAIEPGRGLSQVLLSDT